MGIRNAEKLQPKLQQTKINETTFSLHQVGGSQRHIKVHIIVYENKKCREAATKIAAKKTWKGTSVQNK
jgi:hypothetical protein